MVVEVVMRLLGSIAVWSWNSTSNWVSALYYLFDLRSLCSVFGYVLVSFGAWTRTKMAWTRLRRSSLACRWLSAWWSCASRACLSLDLYMGVFLRSLC